VRDGLYCHVPQRQKERGETMREIIVLFLIFMSIPGFAGEVELDSDGCAMCPICGRINKISSVHGVSFSSQCIHSIYYKYYVRGCKVDSICFEDTELEQAQAKIKQLEAENERLRVFQHLTLESKGICIDTAE